MKKIGYLLVAILGNALGTVIMSNTNVGMTAWGASSSNTALFFNVELGTGFIILSIFFYILALIIRKMFSIRELVSSFLFLISFAFLTNLLLKWFPTFTHLSYIVRTGINFIGFCILLFSIALHLKIQLAVHPMDVYLHSIQNKLGILKGTYISYITAFSVAILFGLANGELVGFGIGTVFTITLSGVIMSFYDKKILCNFKI